MKINPKFTGALAWTGLVLVLAVPAADMLGGKPEAKANLTAEAEPVKAATVQPVATAESTPKPAAKPVVPAIETAAATDDPVTDFVKSGRKMPSYISGNDAPIVDEASTPREPTKKPGTITVKPDGTIDSPATAATPAPTTPAAEEPVVASIKPDLVAPIPLPASARPRPGSQIILPAPTDQPLILDENTVASTGNGPLPPEDIVPEDQLVTGEDLEDWDSGSLAEYLERQGLMSEAAGPETSDFDDDGFYLDNPDRPRRSRVIVLGD